MKHQTCLLAATYALFLWKDEWDHLLNPNEAVQSMVRTKITAVMVALRKWATLP